MIAVRPATAADAAEAARVMRASIRHLCTADHGDDRKRIAAWCANKTAGEVRLWLTHPGSRVFVAEEAGRIAAVGAISTAGEVTLNYVAPHFRFRGASTALLARLEAELHALGHTEARLESTATAYRFYRARGWEDVTAPSSRPASVGLPMRKRLA